MEINTALLDSAIAFTFTLRKWGNIKKADKSMIETDSNKNMLKLSKCLIESPEYDAILSFQAKVRQYLVMRSVPSFFKAGIYLFKEESVELIDEYIKNQVLELNRLVNALIEVYPEQVRAARIQLNGQFNESNYPDTATLRKLFKIEWNWIKLSIPEQLPQQIFESEKEKAEQQWQEAAEEIIMCLRNGFKELVDHAIDRLTVRPGQNKKVFRDSLIENIKEFIETFNMRNIMNDTELAEQVRKARGILSSISPADLRFNDGIRDYTSDKFKTIQKELDRMIVTSPSRRFSFSEA